MWGFTSVSKTYEERTRCITAASWQVAYNNGYANQFSLYSIDKWNTDAIEQIAIGVSSSEIMLSHNNGFIGVADNIENNDAGYLHHLFRASIKIKVLNTNSTEIDVE